jgi:predicted DNA-binding WGR domain protein
MRIYMQTTQMGNKAPRFYHLHMQEDLLDGWTLIKESGYQGAAGKVTKEYYSNHDDALEALIATKDKQVARGYRIVFAQGENIEGHS